MINKQTLVAEIALWFFVIAFSLQMGAGLYEMFVVTPLWSHDLPHSVREFNRDEKFALKPGENFWRFCTPAVGVTAFVSMLFGVRAGVHRRKWILMATLPTLVLVLFTYLYFAPVSMEILVRHGEGMSDAQLIEKVHQWTVLGRIRAALYVCTWLASLKALSIPAAAESK